MLLNQKLGLCVSGYFTLVDGVTFCPSWGGNDVMATVARGGIKNLSRADPS